MTGLACWPMPAKTSGSERWVFWKEPGGDMQTVRRVILGTSTCLHKDVLRWSLNISVSQMGTLRYWFKVTELTLQDQDLNPTNLDAASRPHSSPFHLPGRSAPHRASLSAVYRKNPPPPNCQTGTITKKKKINLKFLKYQNLKTYN
jgi:hypothetical protein